MNYCYSQIYPLYSYPLTNVCGFMSQFVFFGSTNPSVSYSFLVPGKSAVISGSLVKWKIESWSACSEKCAGGKNIMT